MHWLHWRAYSSRTRKFLEFCRYSEDNRRFLAATRFILYQQPMLRSEFGRRTLNCSSSVARSLMEWVRSSWSSTWTNRARCSASAATYWTWFCQITEPPRSGSRSSPNSITIDGRKSLWCITSSAISRRPSRSISLTTEKRLKQHNLRKITDLANKLRYQSRGIVFQENGLSKIRRDHWFYWIKAPSRCADPRSRRNLANTEHSFGDRPTK